MGENQYILTKNRVGEMGEVLRHVRALTGIVQVAMTFGPFDAVRMVETPDLNLLGRRMAWDIPTIPVVAETLTGLAVNPA